MKTKIFATWVLTLLTVCHSPLVTAHAQGTAFTYQGRLNDGATPASGVYDLRFAIYDAASSGAQPGGLLTNSATAVSNGLFTVTLDFGGVFTGADRWLEIAVRTNGGGAFAPLTPRQAVTPTPYALYSATAGTATTAARASAVAAANIGGVISLAQLPATLLTNHANGVTLNGVFSGDGAGVTNVDLHTVNSQGTITWTTNNGFVLASQPGAGTYPYSLTAADVNGDGHVDLISANDYNTLSVYTNSGSGDFVPASRLIVGFLPFSVVAADVNGDGQLALICANYGDNSLTVLTNGGAGNFGVSATLPSVGGNPYSVTAADVTGDGHVDLICANSADHTLTVYTNNGSGSFAMSALLTVGQRPVSVTAADVNGDGHVDLISANNDDKSLTVLTNNGRGGFLLAATPDAGTRPVMVRAADVNRDGRLDLVCVNDRSTEGTPDTFTVLTNDGRGGFTFSSAPVVGYGAFSCTVADVNGDGQVDLISANNHSATLSVLTNDGSGGFALYATLGTVSSFPNAVAAADVNGDGKPDLISANSGGGLSVFLNTTTVSAFFHGSATTITGNISPFQIAGPIPLWQLESGLVVNGQSDVNLTGTFAGNGAGVTNLDLTTADSKGALTWATNLTFALASTPGVSSGNPNSVTAADLNGDGVPDLISANAVGTASGTLSVFLNDGQGHLSSPSILSVGKNPNTVVVAELNGDSWPDLVCENSYDNSLAVFFNDGSGHFNPGPWPATGLKPLTVVAADVNGDGKVDLISANSDATLTVLTNNGFGSFSLASSPSVESGSYSLVAADVNGDGTVDLIAANTYVGSLTILTNNGRGDFGLAGVHRVGDDPDVVVAADFNGDGKTDLITLNYNEGGISTLTILTNDGSGGFRLAASPELSTQPYSMTAADMNGDGKMDLITADGYANTLTVLTNDGHANFTMAGAPATGGSGAITVAAADLNGDGRPDLVSANFTSANVSVLLNTSELQATFRGNVAGNLLGNAATATTATNFSGRLVGDVTGPQNATVVVSVGGVGAYDIAQAANAFGAADWSNTPYTLVRRDGTGNFSAGTISGSFQGNGAGLTNLNAAQFTGGTVPDSLSLAGVAFLYVRGTTTNAGGVPIVTSGFVTSANITNGGAGYTSAPTVVVNDATGSGAVLTANVVHGSVVTLAVQNPGHGYSAGASLTIDPPPSNASQTFVSTNFFTGVNTMNNPANVFTGTFSGNGAGLTNVNVAAISGLANAGFWRTNGNAGADPAKGAFLGTTDNLPLELKVNGQRALRLEPIADEDYNHGSIVNVVAGSPVNFVGTGVVGATISGGGAAYYWGIDSANRVDADLSTISGGGGNTIQTEDFAATIGGGWQNTIQTRTSAATISGGDQNTIQTDAYEATISGGANNKIQTNATFATIGGGINNTILNLAGFATIPGGRDNSATNFAFAAGRRAKANHTGAFVWADSQDADFASTMSNQFNVRANGGVRFVTSGAGLTVDGQPVLTGGTGSGIALGNSSTASGNLSTAMGNGTTASGRASTTMGASTTASGRASIAMGESTTASGQASTAMGNGTEASGFISTAMGASTFASGDNATSMGADTTASGWISTAMGNFTLASGSASTAMGDYTEASGPSSTAMGDGTEASGFSSTAMGASTVASGYYATAMGNSTVASGVNSTAMGASTVASGNAATAMGYLSFATNHSFAAGSFSQALHAGTFVWADFQNITYFNSTAPNQFLVRASGGVGINMNHPDGASLYVQGERTNGWSHSVGFFENTSAATNVAPALRVVNGSGTSPDGALSVSAAGPGLIAEFGNAFSFVVTITNDGTIYSKGLALTSDRNAKEHFTALDAKTVLAKVAALPVTQWNYKDDGLEKKHIGPVAQDFQAAFGLNGGDDRHISVVDEGGVALAAIQGLNQRLEAQQAENTALQAQLAELKKLVQSLVEKQ